MIKKVLFPIIIKSIGKLVTKLWLYKPLWGLLHLCWPFFPVEPFTVKFKIPFPTFEYSWDGFEINQEVHWVQWGFRKNCLRSRCRGFLIRKQTDTQSIVVLNVWSSRYLIQLNPGKICWRPSRTTKGRDVTRALKRSWYFGFVQSSHPVERMRPNTSKSFVVQHWHIYIYIINYNYT